MLQTSYGRNNGFKTHQYHICKENSSLSSEAASFYYENRYTAYEECTKPCKSLKVISNLKYKRKSDKDKKSGQVKLFFPREVQVTEEIVVTSPLSLGLFNFVFQNAFTLHMSFSVAEIGGYLGMTLGVNLLDLEVIFKTFYMLCSKNFFNKTSK